MEAKQLIELNNQKRGELTKENEKIYSDFMVYIRLQLTLSEQQSEELLMEILDHLIEAQTEGKPANVLFGNDPKKFTDELIADIPKENRKNAVSFISGLVFQLLSYFLLANGIISLIVSFFGKKENVLYLLKSGLTFLMIALGTFFVTWLIFKIARNTLFTEEQNHRKNMIVVGTAGAAVMAIIMAAIILLPDSGPAIEFPWYMSVSAGLLAWGVSHLLKNSRFAAKATV
ncbi:DUF1129 family protein [Neobacillus notoginsengisoli]|uniref:DUF1129 family protein n=1 Tax=Neobacillus notoginsengisoli TaxID=1578198 RepID=A0A417YV71_9BACI|nr:DUF1129 family protein [Neobacillus notoginsengisoli]RHW41169.1 DUF1129 family protein [Neobacillus notoginsengisoli]